MDRRKFLQGSFTAAIGGSLLAERAFAQGPAPAPAPTTPAVTPRKLIIDASSRSLQWLRTPEEVAKATIELTCGGVCLNVGAYPAHVDPARLKQDLPTFVSRVRAAGVRVAQIKGPHITEPDDPLLETFVGSAAQAGCTHYSVGGFTYDPAKPIIAQLDALKPRVARFVRLNEKHKMKLTFDTRPVANAVGPVVWDLLYVMKEFDPRFVGLHWDTGHMALHGDTMWETLMRTAGPYVASIGWRDREWQQDIGLKGEGGPYPGPPPVAPGARGAGPGAGARAGAPPAGRAGGGAAPAAGPGGAAGAPAAGRGGAGGRGGGTGEMPKTPLAGLIARGNGWKALPVAMGTGIVDIVRTAAILNEIGFNGPSDLQSEYPSLAGPDTGADKILRPRQFVIGLLKRDVLTIRKAFEMAGPGLEI